MSATAVHYTKDTHHSILVEIKDSQPGLDYLVVGDSTRGPPDVFVILEVVRTQPGGLFKIWTKVLSAPYFLPPRTFLRTAIAVPPDVTKQRRLPSVCWAEVIGRNRPAVMCRVVNGNSTAFLEGMVDTGADVTVIANSEWPGHWGLRASGKVLKGIGGESTTLRSSAPLTIDGPDGTTATMRPFVVPSGFTLWGRDVLSQWGTCLEVPPGDRGFW